MLKLPKCRKNELELQKKGGKMLAYIKGELAAKNIGYIVIDVGGLGYKIFISDKSIETIGKIGEIVKVYTYYRVMEDDISIFGFKTKEELRMFELLISVSGVGAKSAISMLSSIEASDFAIAVVSDDVNTLKKLPGIGAKTAQRIILELKDKIKKEQTISEITNAVNTKEIQASNQNKNQNIEEMKTALQVLGYSRKDIETASSKIKGDKLNLEELIKEALKILSN